MRNPRRFIAQVKQKPIYELLGCGDDNSQTDAASRTEWLIHYNEHGYWLLN